MRNPYVQAAVDLKEIGNAAFLRKPSPDYREAAEHYSRALGQLDESGADNEAEPLALRCTLLQNRAACRLHLRYYQQCLDDCNEVLAFDKGRAKARYRRGLAYEGLQRYEEALEDLEAVRAVDASPPVEDALDRVEIRQQLQGVTCAWTPETLRRAAARARAPSGFIPGWPTEEEAERMEMAVQMGFNKLCVAVRKGRRPSPTVLRLLGIYSGREDVDFARAKCIALASRETFDRGLTPPYQSWFEDEEVEWTDLILDWSSVTDTEWAALVRRHGGLPGRRNSRIPGQPDVKEAATRPPARSSSGGSSSGGSSSGGGRGSVIGAEEGERRGAGGGKRKGMAAGGGWS